jgi:GNAT superfamily N-acetyltransferase
MRSLELQAAFVHPAFQGRGIGFALNARMSLHELSHRPLGSRWVVIAVVNPVAFSGWRRRFQSPDAVYPRLDGVPPSHELLEAAVAAASDLHPQATFDPLTGVLHGRTKPRSVVVPASGEAEVDAYFARNLDPAAGDVLLAIVDARRAEVLRIARQVPTLCLRSLKPKAGRTRRSVR